MNGQEQRQHKTVTDTLRRDVTSFADATAVHLSALDARADEADVILGAHTNAIKTAGEGNDALQGELDEEVQARVRAELRWQEFVTRGLGSRIKWVVFGK